MQCLTSDLFKDFPTLKFLIPHGGGAPTTGAASAAWRRR
jgi:predicted TIM-barrel fold metal-dependent hydrolase